MKNLFMNRTNEIEGQVTPAKSGKMNKKGKKSPSVTKRGFTLVEILIVVAVIGILFISLVPRIDFAGDKARETGIKTDFRSFELAARNLKLLNFLQDTVVLLLFLNLSVTIRFIVT